MSSAGGGPSMIPRRTSVSSGSGNPLTRSNGASSSSAATTALSSSGLPLPAMSSVSRPSTSLGKRTSLQAGLSYGATPSTVKRASATSSSLHAVPSTPSPNLTSLRQDIQASASAAVVQRQLNSSQRENASLLRELGSIQERVKNLEKERSILLTREEKAHTRDTEKEQRQDEQIRELTASLKEFRNRCSVLEEENDGLISRSKRAVHDGDLAREQKDSIEKQMLVLQEELEKVDEENQSLKAGQEELRVARETIQSLQRELAERPKPTPEQAPADSSVQDVLRKELHHQVTHLRTLEHNNARLTREIAALKAEKTNVEVLKEEKLSLEHRLRNFDTLRDKCAALEGECQMLQKEKLEWAVYLKDSTEEQAANADASNMHEDVPSSPTFSRHGTPVKGHKDRFSASSPAAVTKSLAKARISNLSLQDKLGNMTAQLKSRDMAIEELEVRLKELDDEASSLKKEVGDLKEKAAGLERMKVLDARELSMLREQINTYATEELSLQPSAGTSEQTDAPATLFDTQKSLRISHLEELLEAYKSESAKAGKEATRLRGLLEVKGEDTEIIDAFSSEDAAATKPDQGKSLTEMIRENEQLREDLQTAQASVAELELELESLDSQIDVLNLTLGRGEYNVATTKVISLAENPAAVDLAIRTETLDRLKEENRVLLEKIGEMEKLTPAHSKSPQLASSASIGDSSEETVPKATFTNLQAENASLQNKIEQAEKSRQRLKEIFSKTAQELRDACRYLFGYKIEPLEAGRIKVITVFGGNDYSLVFGPETVSGQSKSKYQLVSGAEQFVTSQRVQQGLEFWVAERGCIPGFLSSLSLELFEESTRGRTSGWTEAE